MLNLLKKMTTLNALVLCILVATHGVAAQSKNDTAAATELYTQIATLDETLFAAFNTCNLEKVGSLFTEDVEFYHEKSGLILTRTRVIEVMKANLCSPYSNRVRRELIKTTLQVSPINNYGAVQTGEHRFYLTQKDQKERLDGIGKFIHIWQNKDGIWKISRVVSYGFRPPE